MINTKYVVHSDIDENNIYAEFNILEDAIDYAKGSDNGIADKTYVDAVEVEFDEDGTITGEDSETVWSYLDELDDDSLEEDTHATKAQPELDRVRSYNDALRIAKEENKPVIYGYMGSDHHGENRYFKLDNIVCDDIIKCSDEVKRKYHPNGSILIAYPDKSFVDESLEDTVPEDLADDRTPIIINKYELEEPLDDDEMRAHEAGIDSLKENDYKQNIEVAKEISLPSNIEHLLGECLTEGAGGKAALAAGFTLIAIGAGLVVAGTKAYDLSNTIQNRTATYHDTIELSSDLEDGTSMDGYDVTVKDVRGLHDCIRTITLTPEDGKSTTLEATFVSYDEGDTWTVETANSGLSTSGDIAYVYYTNDVNAKKTAATGMQTANDLAAKGNKLNKSGVIASVVGAAIAAISKFANMILAKRAKAKTQKQEILKSAKNTDEDFHGNPEIRTTHLEYEDDDVTDGKAVLPDNISKKDVSVCTINKGINHPADTKKELKEETIDFNSMKEALEENEDEVECACCNELFAKTDCVHENGYGWVCPDCQAGTGHDDKVETELFDPFEDLY